MCAGVDALSPVAIFHGLTNHAALLNCNHFFTDKLLSCSNFGWTAQTVEDDISLIVALEIGHLLEVSVDSQFDGASCKKTISKACSGESQNMGRNLLVCCANKTTRRRSSSSKRTDKVEE